MAAHNLLGSTGEELTAAFLLTKGYTILARNFRFKKAEIDIIASLNNNLIFVEVKTRSTNKYGYPEEFVSKRKQELFLEAAEEYIFRHDWQHDIRFDIISVSVSSNGKFSFHHIEDAFH